MLQKTVLLLVAWLPVALLTVQAQAQDQPPGFAEIQKRFAKYYKISEKFIRQQHYQQLQQLLGQGISRSMAEEKLKPQLYAALDQAGNFCSRLARSHAGNSPELYRQALAYFEKEDIEGALALLNRAAIVSRVQQLKKEGSQPPEKEKNNGQLLQTLLLKGNLHLCLLSFDSAALCYRLVAEANRNNTDILFQIAQFPEPDRSFEQSQALYQKTLELSTNEAEKASRLKGFADFLYFSRQKEQDQAAAYEAYRQALDIYKRLTVTQAGLLPEAAEVHMQLALFYSTKGERTPAEQHLKQALQIYEQLAAEDEAAYLPQVAMVLGQLANVYGYSDSPEVMQYYGKALQIYEQLARREPDLYLPYSGRILHEMALFSVYSLDYSQAEKYYLQSLHVYEELMHKEPVNYLPGLLYELDCLGSLYHELQKNYPQAREVYSKMLKLFEQEACQQIPPYLEAKITLAEVLDHLSLLEEDPLKKIALQERLVALLEKNCELACSQQQKDELAKNYGELAGFLLFDRQFARAQQYALKALDKDPGQEWIKTKLILAYLFDKQYAKAEALYNEIKDIQLFTKYDEDASARELLLEALHALEKAGVSHPDVAKFRKLLN